MYMSDTLYSPNSNSFWPNGMKEVDGYAVYFPLGTNKSPAPSDETSWPRGSKLITPFVYDENDILVGFCDTKAMTAESGTTIHMPYEYIQADFSSIDKNNVIINAPHSSIKKVKWLNSNYYEYILGKKYITCETVDEVLNIDYYKSASIAEGVWCESLENLKNGYGMFYNCTNLTSFISDSSRLTNGGSMFTNCYYLTTFSSDLSSLTDGYGMFADCANLVSLSSDSSGSPVNLSKLTDGNRMFYHCGNLKTFTSNLSSLTTGREMFSNCDSFTSFSSDLSTLTNGEYMFYHCGNLKTFTSNLSSLTTGREMFYECENLNSFNADLSSLTNGYLMFHYCFGLASFSSALPSLTEGGSMFDGCTSLSSFSSDLHNLTNGAGMFYNCKNLTSFTSNLSSLTNGGSMFRSCKLDASSVMNIIDTINTVTNNPSILIGMGCNNTTNDKNLFAQEVGYDDMTSLLAALQAKGWNVTAQYNGRPTTTYSLRRPSEDTLPVFVKLIETEEFADYTSDDNTIKYRLEWYHDSTTPQEDYIQYNSIEEAIETLNIKQIERN